MAPLTHVNPHRFGEFVKKPINKEKPTWRIPYAITERDAVHWGNVDGQHILLVREMPKEELARLRHLGFFQKVEGVGGKAAYGHSSRSNMIPKQPVPEHMMSELEEFLKKHEKDAVIIRI